MTSIATTINQFGLKWWKTFTKFKQTITYVFLLVMRNIKNTLSRIFEPTINFDLSLQICKQITDRQCEISVNALHKVENLTKDFLSDFSDQCNFHVDGFETKDLKNFCEEYKIEILDTKVNEFRNIHEKNIIKKEKLKYFTIALIGRTIAGKSTIKETIIQGDGKSIGKGAQRTTRDIQEFFWKDLRFLDTPGIGAFDSETDRELALTAADESDLVLFILSSDSTQEEILSELSKLRTEKNIPIIFVLNMKKNLDRPNNLKAFLENPKRVFDEDVVNGHLNRINRCVRDELKMKDLKIAIIHAQIAFQSTRESNIRYSKKLKKASNFDSLLKLLSVEISEFGPAMRIQNFLEESIGTLIVFERQLKDCEQTLKLYRKNYSESMKKQVEILTEIEKNIKKRVKTESGIPFDEVRSEISYFVDENLDNPEYGKKLKYFIDESLDLENWTENLIEEFNKDIQLKFEELNRQLNFSKKSWKLGSITNELSEHSQYDPWDFGKILRWVSIPVAFVPHPIVRIASFGIAIISNFFSSRDEKLQKRKEEEQDKIFSELDIMEKNLITELSKEFRNGIRVMKNDIEKNLNSVDINMKNILKTLRKFVKNVENMTIKLNCHLIIESGNQVLQIKKVTENNQLMVENIISLEREQGIKTDVRWDANTKFQKFCSQVSDALNELVIGKIGEDEPKPKPRKLSSNQTNRRK